MKYITLLLCLLLLLMVAPAEAQTPVATETVSINQNTRINEAAMILETYTMKHFNKKLINLSSFNGPINVPINNLAWDKALDLIVLQNRLIRKDNAGYISIEDVPVVVPPVVVPDPLVVIAGSKQIRIKAIAMLADRSYTRSMGIDWSSITNGKITVNAGFPGASQVVSPMTFTASGSADLGKFQVDVSTALKAIESNQKGNIIAQPTILVSSGKKGFIQVGQDISVKTTDEAGNTMDTFFATGVIMDVTPTVVTVNGEDLIHLILSIERSSGVPNAVSTVIAKSKSATELVLFNNEETVIAGLFDTDETKARSGIPILKDLPWWVFGIRYLTGYSSFEKKEREMVISLQAEIVESAYDRFIKAAQDKNQ
ncbi:type II and III secretion system protein [Candidatus Cloacimonadota bacterium]